MSFALGLIRPFGIDIFCIGKKFLVFNMVDRNLKVKYRRSVLGLLWTLLSPLSLVGVYYFVFKVVLNIQTPNYMAYLVSGILPWAFFSSTIMEGMDSISGNAGLISKIPVPIQSFPLVVVLTNLITLCLALPIMVGVSLVSGISLGPSVILLPVLLMLLAFMAYGVALMFGLFYVFLQDLKHLVGLIIQLWFYATPVLYAASNIPPKYSWILYVNPVGLLFRSLHQILTDGTWPRYSELAVSCGWSFAILFAGVLCFKWLNQDVAENL